MVVAPENRVGAGRVVGATGEQATSAQSRRSTTHVRLFIFALTLLIRRYFGGFGSGSQSVSQLVSGQLGIGGTENGGLKIAD